MVSIKIEYNLLVPIISSINSQAVYSKGGYTYV